MRYCKECDLLIETSKIEGNELWGFGLYFGGQQVGMSFLINGSGQYALREFRGDSIFYNKSGDFSFSSQVHQGNGNNFLKVQYKGDHVILWANGEMLESISINPSFRITRVGLVADSISKSGSKKEFEIHFDNLCYFNSGKITSTIKACVNRIGLLKQGDNHHYKIYFLKTLKNQLFLSHHLPCSKSFMILLICLCPWKC